MKAALRYRWKHGGLTEPPHILQLPPPPPRQRFLTQDEFQRLLAECHEPRLRLFVMLMAHTLQRPRSVLGLRTDRVDLDRNRIDFNEPSVYHGNTRRVVVPITATPRPLVKDAVHESCSGFVVESEGRQIRAAKTSFNKARDRAGIPDVTAFTLRHTGATLLAAAGIPLQQIAGMLGHSDTRTTEKHYAKHRPEILQDAAEALDMIFAKDREVAPAPQPKSSPLLTYSQRLDHD